MLRINGNARCYGHSECDNIVMDESYVQAIPEITANSVEASLVHEAAIGKIAGEQITKLMTLGLTEAEAEEQIVAGIFEISAKKTLDKKRAACYYNQADCERPRKGRQHVASVGV